MEGDDVHFEKLNAALAKLGEDLGAELVDHEWGVGGSQEIERWTARIGTATLTVESETYVGLTIFCDDAALLERLRRALSKTS